MKSLNYNELIKDFGIIYFNHHNHIEKIINKKGNYSIIKIITINSLKEEINFFKPKTFNFFLEKGLNKNSKQKSTICLLLKNKSTKQYQVISYSFICNNMKDSDIPFYHQNVPDGFSLFCSENEYIQILSYLKSEEYKKQLEMKKKKEEEQQILENEPEPNRKEFLCQICKSRFDNYLEHINSKLHKKNKTNFLNTFNKIKLSFQRIVDYNKIKNNKNNSIKEEKKDITNKININDNIAIETTKEESLSFTEDNKINLIKEKQRICERISQKENEENNKSEDLSMKELLNILNSIKEKDNITNKNTIIPHKRKKNEQKKYFLIGNNYVHDLKLITEKISYFNNLYKNNK